MANLVVWLFIYLFRSGAWGSWWCMSSQFVAVGVLTKSPGEIKSREVELGSHSCWTVLLQLAFPQQLLIGHCLCDFAPHSCWNSNSRSTQVASHWRGPHLLNFIVMAVADELLGFYRSERADDLSISSRPPPPPPHPPSSSSLSSRFLSWYTNPHFLWQDYKQRTFVQHCRSHMIHSTTFCSYLYTNWLIYIYNYR